MTVAGMAVAGGAAKLRAHQRQRQLTGQEFIESKPRPEQPVRQNVGQLGGDVDAGERLADRRKVAAADHLRADPFGQLRQLCERLRDRAFSEPSARPSVRG